MLHTEPTEAPAESTSPDGAAGDSFDRKRQDNPQHTAPSPENIDEVGHDVAEFAGETLADCTFVDHTEVENGTEQELSGTESVVSRVRDFLPAGRNPSADSGDVPGDAESTSAINTKKLASTGNTAQDTTEIGKNTGNGALSKVDFVGSGEGATVGTGIEGAFPGTQPYTQTQGLEVGEEGLVDPDNGNGFEATAETFLPTQLEITAQSADEERDKHDPSNGGNDVSTDVADEAKTEGKSTPEEQGRRLEANQALLRNSAALSTDGKGESEALEDLGGELEEDSQKTTERGVLEATQERDASSPYKESSGDESTSNIDSNSLDCHETMVRENLTARGDIDMVDGDDDGPTQKVPDDGLAGESEGKTDFVQSLSVRSSRKPQATQEREIFQDQSDGVSGTSSEEDDLDESKDEREGAKPENVKEDVVAASKPSEHISSARRASRGPTIEMLPDDESESEGEVPGRGLDVSASSSITEVGPKASAGARAGSGMAEDEDEETCISQIPRGIRSETSKMAKSAAASGAVPGPRPGGIGAMGSPPARTPPRPGFTPTQPYSPQLLSMVSPTFSSKSSTNAKPNVAGTGAPAGVGPGGRTPVTESEGLIVGLALEATKRPPDRASLVMPKNDPLGLIDEDVRTSASNDGIPAASGTSSLSGKENPLGPFPKPTDQGHDRDYDDAVVFIDPLQQRPVEKGASASSIWLNTGKTTAGDAGGVLFGIGSPAATGRDGHASPIDWDQVGAARQCHTGKSPK